MSDNSIRNLDSDYYSCHCGKDFQSERAVWIHVKKTGHLSLRRFMVQRVTFIK